jgi:replicative DNA helicase
MADSFPPDRLPPQNLDAERGLLGSLLRDNGVIGDVLQIVQHSDVFYYDAHQKIFQAIKDIYDAGKPIDLIILAERLRSQGQLDDVGKAPYLAELWQAAPTAANAEYYARIVREKSLSRGLIHASTEILRDAYDQVTPADELLGAAERKILEIAEKGVTGTTSTLQVALNEAYARMDARKKGGYSEVSGIPTGFVDLDHLTAGLQNSELIILAARPSVGKTAFSLNIIRHVVVEEKVPAFFVSLEQAKIELAERLLVAQARVDSHKLRKGTLNGDEMTKLLEAGDILHRAPLFIDDSPAQTMLRIAANARRLRLKNRIRLVVIDYLQLIEPENRRDPRQEQVAQTSRRLKFLARELNIPVIALAQVNRASEDRQDHRPRLADLRESGCLTGDARILMADSGKRVPIRELLGKTGFRVLALNEQNLKFESSEVSNVFSTGIKAVFRLDSRTGRSIRATGNHPLRTLQGWKRLDELRVGDRIAVPRNLAPASNSTMTDQELGLLGHLIGDGCVLPRHVIQYTTREMDLAELVRDLASNVFGTLLQPRISRERNWFQVYLSTSSKLTHGKRNPVSEWFDSLGIFGLRSYEKYVPEKVFELSTSKIGVFLRHLWATDGCIRPGKTDHHPPAIYYASSSERLARDVQHLLLRCGINAVLRSIDQSDKGRTQFHVMVTGKPEICRFTDLIGAVGIYKSESLKAVQAKMDGKKANTNRDIIPSEVWNDMVRPAMKVKGIALRPFHSALGMACMGTGLFRQNVSRDRLARIARVLPSEPKLRLLAESDIYWDEVRTITPAGFEEVFDLTVPAHANFVANDILVHNSIEQDADTCFMLHRPGKFDGGIEDNIIEVIVAKQRNGPTGEVTLRYIKEHMRYDNYGGDLDYQR